MKIIFCFSPFGMLMPARKFSAANGYRYGFNGKENDNEVKGEGNELAFENRIYDPRTGRWLSVDPLQKKYAPFSPYNFVENNPLIYKDVDGRDKWLIITINDERTGKSIAMSVKLSDELMMQVTGTRWDNRERNYYDININYNITVDKNGKANVTVSQNRGIFRIAIDKGPDGSGISSDEKWARTKMWWKDLFTTNPQKQADIGEGFWMTSENAKGLGDPYAPGAKKVTKIENADAFLIMLGKGLDYAEGTPQLMEELKDMPKDKIERFLNAMVQAFQTTQNVSEMIEMAKEEISKTNVTKKDNTSTKPYAGYKKGTILHTNIGNVRVDSDSTGTCCQDDKKATDTVPSARKKMAQKKKDASRKRKH